MAVYISLCNAHQLIHVALIHLPTLTAQIHWLPLAGGLRRLLRLHYDVFYTIRCGCSRARADAGVRMQAPGAREWRPVRLFVAWCVFVFVFVFVCVRMQKLNIKYQTK